ncbi:hypothetical protein MRX96_059813 [Rhipicephalus microplus]
MRYSGANVGGSDVNLRNGKRKSRTFHASIYSGQLERLGHTRLSPAGRRCLTISAQLIHPCWSHHYSNRFAGRQIASTLPYSRLPVEIAVTAAQELHKRNSAQALKMSSYTLPEITDPVVQAAISAQRRAPGVHIYLDAAYKDSTNAWIYSNVICDIEKTKTVTYSFLVQIHKDNPDYAIGFIVPDDDKVGARTGFDIKTQTLYGSVKTYYPNTWWTYVTIVNNATLKAGDFVVHTLQYTYPSKNLAYESEMRVRKALHCSETLLRIETKMKNMQLTHCL